MLLSCCGIFLKTILDERKKREIRCVALNVV